MYPSTNHVSHVEDTFSWLYIHYYMDILKFLHCKWICNNAIKMYTKSKYLIYYI